MRGRALDVTSVTADRLAVKSPMSKYAYDIWVNCCIAEQRNMLKVCGIA
jgi:hypothetical protein